MGEPRSELRLAGGQSPPAPTTLMDKLWQQHLVMQRGEQALLAMDRVFLHERMGSIALKSLRERGRKIQNSKQVFCTIDHIVDTLPGRGDDTRVPGGRAFIEETRDAARAENLRLFDVNDPDQGIVHVISPELGIALPGLTIACPDSHTCTQGGVGALAWGIGSSEAEHALATGTLRLKKPKTMRIKLDGKLAPSVSAKDISLLLISRYGTAGGKGHVIEYAGTAVSSLDIEARLTLCNMATEFSAATALVAADDTTYTYLHGRRYAPRDALWDVALQHWRTLRSDVEAIFDREIKIDIDALAPMITWGTSPQHAVAITDCVPDAEHSGASAEAYERAIAYMGLAPGQSMTSLKIDAVFLGSCTNARIADLRSAAKLLAGRHVASGVRALCVPGSSSVKRQAEAEGLDKIFIAAGFEWRESGCSMCFYAGGENMGAGARVVSSTNRNFEGRQGPNTRTHIASPATVAASAIAGHIADVRQVAHS